MKPETENTPPRPVAVLCVTPRSHYKKMAGCDCYDEKRNAWTHSSSSGMPVVAHPPCRSWGRMRGFVKADVRNERDLALACVGKVRTCGGVLEHPFASTLFDVCKLPKPGGGTDMYGGFTLKIFQGNFGHLVPKPTLLYICGCTPADIPEIPFQLIGETGRKFESLSANQRKATPPLFAEWLVSIARRCRRKGSVS